MGREEGGWRGGVGGGAAFRSPPGLSAQCAGRSGRRLSPPLCRGEEEAPLSRPALHVRHFQPASAAGASRRAGPRRAADRAGPGGAGPGKAGPQRTAPHRTARSPAPASSARTGCGPWAGRSSAGAAGGSGPLRSAVSATAPEAGGETGLWGGGGGVSPMWAARDAPRRPRAVDGGCPCPCRRWRAAPRGRAEGAAGAPRSRRGAGLTCKPGAVAP